MSIGVERVNGGFIGGQWTEGSLTFLKITGPATAFNGSYALTDTAKGPRPAPGSAAEAVYKVISQRGTPVIAEIVSDTEIHVAMAYGTRDDDELLAGQTALATELETAIKALGAAAVFKRFGLPAPGALNADVIADGDALRDTAALDFSAAGAVEVVDFELA